MTGAAEPKRSPQEVVERVLANSRADQCVVIVTDSSDADVRFARNTATTNGTRRSRNLSVVSFLGSADKWSVGTASRSGEGSDDDIEQLLVASEEDATSGSDAEDASPLVSSTSAGPGYDQDVETTGAEALSGVVTELAGTFERARSNDFVLAGFATHQVSTSYLGSSTGLRLRHAQPSGTLELVARSADGERSAWAGVARPWLDEVEMRTLEDRLVRRLEWAKRRIELEPGRYETLLPPDAAADLVIMLEEALSGRDAEDGRNVFSGPKGKTKVGDKLFELPFELRSDPSEQGIECAPFLATGASSSDVSVFDNGSALSRTNWIEGGYLRRLRYHRAAARRSGVQPAFPIDNLALELPDASSDLDDLVRGTGRGLLLTCLWYIREVDPQTLLLTGLTRDGVYLVEQGEVVGAVNNFRFNESPVDVLERTIEAGRSERAFSREWGEWLPRTRMPPLRVADFNMSSVSPAT